MARLFTSLAGRPRTAPKQRRAARLGDHRLGVAVAQRQHAQGKIAHHLDGHAAHAEGEGEAEIGIARHAGEHLDAVGDEFLHQERNIGRPRLKLVETLIQLRISARQRRVILKIDGDEPKLGFVRDRVR